MKLALFDFDGTLFDGQTIPFLMKLYKEKGYDKSAYNRYMLQVLRCILKYKNPFVKAYDKEHFRREAALLFLKMFNDKEEKYLTRFMNEAAIEMNKVLNPKVIEEVGLCQKEGYHTVVLSGCYTILLEQIGKHLQIDTVIGTSIGQEHITKGMLHIDTLDIATGKRKVEKVLEVFQDKHIDWQNSVAYGDSSYDYDILSMVGHPVAVGPDDKLRQIATDNKWRIIE